MTATASRADMNGITDSLGLKNCKFIIGNPDRKNIFYEKVFRHGQDFDAIQSILMPIDLTDYSLFTQWPRFHVGYLLEFRGQQGENISL